MSKRSEREWLSDIVSWGERMQRHMQGIERPKFLVQDVVAKCIEALGESGGEAG